MVWERTRSDDVLELEVGVELVHFRAGKGDAHENLQAGQQRVTRNKPHIKRHASNTSHVKSLPPVTRQMFTTRHTSTHLVQLVSEHDFSRLRVGQDAFEVAQASARIHVQIVTKKPA